MEYGAYGLVRVMGEANAVLVLDQMLKAADVQFEAQDVKCGGYALVFVKGDVAAVKAAVESVKANPICHVSSSAVISSPCDEMIEIVKRFKK